MKKKILYLVFVLTLVFALFSVATFAAEFRSYAFEKPTACGAVSADALPVCQSTLEKQQACGLIPQNLHLLAVTNSGTYLQAFLSADLSTCSITGGTGSSATISSSITIYRYRWSNSVGWLYDTCATTFPAYHNSLYYSSIPVIPSANLSEFVGYNPNATFDSDLVNCSDVFNYYNTLYDSFANGETNVQNAYDEGYSKGHSDGYNSGTLDGYLGGRAQGYTEGYEVGYKEGETEGYSTGYDEGYDEGYHFGYSSGYNVGLYDCDKTHAALTRTVREEALAYGKTLGMAWCEENLHSQILQEGVQSGYELCANENHDTIALDNYKRGYDNGCADGSAMCSNTNHATIASENYNRGHSEGYNSGFACGEVSGYEIGFAEGDIIGYDRAVGDYSKKLNEAYRDGEVMGYAIGKEIGYTEAMNDGNVVLDFVDSIFSAPVKFLRDAFDISVFGINIFRVLMLFVLAIIVFFIIRFVSMRR